MFFLMPTLLQARHDRVHGDEFSSRLFSRAGGHWWDSEGTYHIRLTDQWLTQTIDWGDVYAPAIVNGQVAGDFEMSEQVL